ncbi:4Fe-4S binding protein [Streptosporangium amethystogenes]|uniref:4Fe-4S binding protein n=1 Tax=Streptosporangium amethystogenes TaxID=2002 RepID=UPI0037B14576
MLSRSVTQQYPEVRPDLPPRSRGVIALVEENCTVCMLCARECPDWCIYIDSHKETLPAPEGGRPRARNMLDRFAIDFSLCMYCGICIEVCPFDALFWSPEFEYAEGDIRNLLHEKEKLAAWAQTVPPPPAHEPGAEPPKELTAGSRPIRPRPAPGPPAPAPGAPPTSGARPPAPSAPGTPSTPGTRAPAPDTPPPGADTSSTSGTSAATPDAPPSAAPTVPPAGKPPGRGASAGHASVRAIRPPGALPKKDAPSTGESSAEKLSTGRDDVPPKAAPPEQTSSTDPSGEPEEEK